MKVLVIEIYGRGGLTHYTYNLINSLAGRQVEVTLLTSCEYELKQLVGSGGNGIRVDDGFYRTSHHWRDRIGILRRPRIRRWVKIVEFLLDTPRVVSIYRRLKPEVVHLQGCNPILLVTLTALKLQGCRAVYTAHDVPPLSNRLLARLLDGNLYRMADRVVVHSEADREEIHRRFRVPREKVAVIRHGHYLFFRPSQEGSRAEARRRLGVSEDERMMLFFGFLSWYKGLDVLLRALPLVRREIPRARLWAVGDPVKLEQNELQSYGRMARDLGVEDAFTLEAKYVPMEDVPPYFEASDCVVMPYRQVSQSGVLHLAYAFGRPVVATRVGGFPETVREGETGFLVPVEDHESLAGALIDLLRDDHLRERMGERARKEAGESFSWEEAAGKTLDLYVALCR